jgi:hypothetical protein
MNKNSPNVFCRKSAKMAQFLADESIECSHGFHAGIPSPGDDERQHLVHARLHVAYTGRQVMRGMNDVVRIQPATGSFGQHRGKQQIVLLVDQYDAGVMLVRQQVGQFPGGAQSREAGT